MSSDSISPQVIFGLPDSAFLSSKKKIEESILRQRVRLSRHQNRFINKTVESQYKIPSDFSPSGE